MEHKHTPGPWQVSAGAVDNPRLIVENDLGLPVCAMSLRGVQGDINKMEANARLIAAAPELLVALEQLVSDYERGIHVEFGGSPWLKEKLEELDYARAAIAKATGA